MINKVILLLFVWSFSLIDLNGQEWVRQHPFPILKQLQDVDMDPSGIGLAGGNNGVLFRTTDFGANWELVDPGFSNTILKIQFVPGNNGQKAWMGLSGSTRVAKTEDGGTTWTVINIGISLSSASYLAIPNESTIYVGTQNGIAKTEDAGESWTEVSPEPDQNWNTMTFVDANTGWAGTSDGRIFRTTDGGTSWAEPNPDAFDQQLKLGFLDSQTGFAAVFKSIYQTDDGGMSWELLSDIAFATHMGDLDVVDESFILAVRGNSSYTSSDGGMNWERIIPLSYSYINSGICGLPDGRTWVSGSHTMIGHSSDYGLTYQDQIPANKNFLEFIDFFDAQNGWAGGVNGSLLKTTNGGANWEEMPVPTTQKAVGGVIRSAEEVWVCVRDTIYRTVDGGQNWNTLFTSTGGNFTDIQQVDGKVFATTNAGKAFRSTDGGVSWDELPTNFEEDLFGLYFPDVNTGYLAGRDSTVLKTTDGGDSWTPLDLPTTKHFGDAYFLNADRGWILTTSNVPEIFFTDDGGQSWETVSLPISAFWRDMYFVDSDRGYLVGGIATTGIILTTEDGGQTWEILYSTYGLINDMAYVEDELGTRLWISGFGGNIEVLADVQTGTREELSIEALLIAPNPNNGSFQLLLPDHLPDNAVMDLYDNLGQKLWSRQVSRTVNAENLMPGQYYLHINTGTKILLARIIIKN